jgi:hypothetical protein
MPTPVRPTPEAARRGMQMVGAFFGTYALLGFVYPVVIGESVVHTAFKKIGWIDEKTYEKKECSD